MQKLNIQNKKATFEFEILEKFTAGVMLTGTEIKSVREGKVNMSDAFCSFIQGELFVRNLHISEYSFGTHFNHEPKRMRKLLLQKKELRKLHTKVKEKGLTIIPLRLFMSDTGYAKIDIGLAKGKKIYDKRESIKEKDVKRDLSRNMNI
ncbi:MAG: SsrA-binding protein SmpB [Bacteroidia bacterium]